MIWFEGIILQSDGNAGKFSSLSALPDLQLSFTEKQACWFHRSSFKGFSIVFPVF